MVTTPSLRLKRLFTTPSCPPSGTVEDQRVGPGSDVTISQHRLNVVFRDIGNNTDYTDIYLS